VSTLLKNEGARILALIEGLLPPEQVLSLQSLVTVRSKPDGDTALPNVGSNAPHEGHPLPAVGSSSNTEISPGLPLTPESDHSIAY